METQDFQNIWQATTIDGRRGKLVLLDAPTGSGKSYSVMQFLCRQAIQEKNFKAFFVTDQKKNLRATDFQTVWPQYQITKDQSHFQGIAVLRSLTDTVSRLLDDDPQKQKIPTILLADKSVEVAFKKLSEQRKIYLLNEQVNPNPVNWKHLADAEYQVRKTLGKRLAQLAGVTPPQQLTKSETHEKIQQYLLDNDTTVSRWMSDVYPTINLDSFQLYILTTDKFIRSYTPFFKRNGTMFLYSKLLGDSLVVLDEFDSTKERLWEKGCQSALQIKTDLISLFGAILHGFQRISDDIPEDLKQLISHQSRYEELGQIAQELNDQFKLNYLHKIHGEKPIRNFVIHTPLETLISDQRHWHSHFDEKSKRVEISHSVTDDLHFRWMLHRVSGFIRSFNHFIFGCAQRYMNERNAKISTYEEEIDLASSVKSVYAALGLTSEQFTVLLGLEAQVPQSSRTGKKTTGQPDSYHEFQRRGLDLYYFNDSSEHDLQTIINAAFFSSTPEQYLLSLVSHSNVWGLSATANFPTVLHNYDLGYLNEKLGANFIQGRPLLTSETKASFDYTKLYQEKDIQISASVVGGQATLEATVKRWLPDQNQQPNWTVIQELDNSLLETVKKIPQPGERHSRKHQNEFMTRYLSLFESFVVFILRPSAWTFLGLQMLLPSERPEMSEQLIQRTFDELCIQLLPDPQSCELRLIRGRQNSEVTTQIKDALELPSKKTRVYLLSAYQSIGIGQNLQHPITDNSPETYRTLNHPNSGEHDARLTSKDLDGMYLGNVTHLMTNRLQTTDLNSDTLRFVTELEYLLDANEVNYREVKRRFHGIQQNQTIYKKLKGAPSLTASYSRVIVQALGRMNRTFNKSEQPIVLASQDVSASIGPMGLDPQQFIPEYQALLRLSEETRLTLASEKHHHEIICDNLTAYCRRDVQQLISGLQTNPSMATDYQNLRELLLTHPTLDTQTLVQLQNQIHRGLQYLPCHNHASDYSVGIENLKDGSYSFGATKLPQLVVSAKAAGLEILLKYPGMLAYFKKNGYARFWKPQDYQMNPVQFINLYVGMLGEVGGRFILEDILPLQLLPLSDIKNNELFDFQVGDHAAIDFKNWRSSHQESALAARQRVQSKLTRLNETTGKIWRVAIINVIGASDVSDVHVTTTMNHQLMEVPALINSNGQLSLSAAQTQLIGEFLLGK